jgi:hypothetical protein
MSNKFLTGKTGGLDDGTADIYVNSVRVNNIAGSQNVKTDSIGELVEGDVAISDVSGLQANLDTKLDNTIAKFKTQATPGIPPVGELRVYKKSDNRLYQLDSNGLENVFTIGTGGNPFDQNLNTTDSPTFDSLNLTTNNITLGNNLTASNFSTQIGSQGVPPIARGIGNTLVGNDNARDIGINNTIIGSEVLSSGVASGDNIVAIGRGCSQIADLSGNNTVIGFNSAFQGADANSICIGNLAGNASRVDADCILINADNFPLESTGANEIRMKAGNTDLFATPLDITYNGSSIKNDDLNSKTQNIVIAGTSANLTKFDGRVNTDFAFSDNGFDHVIYGTDVSAFTPSIFVDNTIFGSQCGIDLGSDNTNIGFSAGAVNTGERNTNIGSLAGGESASIPQGSNSVCLGYLAGGGNPDGSVCIGSQAGNRCGINSISLGRQAGASTQSSGAIAIGGLSAQANQGIGGISIGENTCNVGQGIGSIAIGQNACSSSSQGASSVAIGNLSALTNQGANAVAIGALSAQTNQDAKTIVLNADTSGLNTTQENEIRMKAGLSTLDLNQTSGLVVNGQNFTTKISDLESKTQNINLANTIAGETHIDNKLFVDGELITEDTEIHLGADVYANNQTASEVVLIGREACQAGSANSVVAIGTQACKFGSGTLSTVIGRFASQLAPSGVGSVIVGNAAGRQTSTGTCSVVIGCEANDGSAITNGQKYICIGNQSGRNGVGSGSIVIGDRAGLGLAVPQNSLIIAAKLNNGGTVASSNEMKFIAGFSEFQYDGTDINFTNVTQPSNKGNLNISTINNLTPVGGFFSQISNIAVNSLANPPTEQAMIADVGVGTRIVPADTFIVGGNYRISMGGFLTCVNNATLTIRIYGGATGTTLLGSLPTLTIPTSTNQWFGIETYFVVRGLGGANAGGVISARSVYSANANNQNAIYGQSFHTINSTLFDSTAPNKLQITAQWGNQNDGTITTTQATFHRIF